LFATASRGNNRTKFYTNNHDTVRTSAAGSSKFDHIRQHYRPRGRFCLFSILARSQISSQMTTCVQTQTQSRGTALQLDTMTAFNTQKHSATARTKAAARYIVIPLCLLCAFCLRNYEPSCCPKDMFSFFQRVTTYFPLRGFHGISRVQDDSPGCFRGFFCSCATQGSIM
jgi:hypothetical protein